MWSYSRRTLSILLVVSSLGLGSADSPSRPSYPVTPRTDVVDEVYGATSSNPYSWLEDLGSPEVASWVAAQEKLTRELLADALEASRPLRARMAAHQESRSINTPVRRGERFFYLAEIPGGGGLGLFVSEVDRGEALLAHADDFTGLGIYEPQITDFRVSPSGNLVVIVVTGEPDQRRIGRILDVDAGRYLPDAIEDARLGERPWSTDEGCLYYSTDEGGRGPGVWRRRLGSKGEEVRLLPGSEPDEVVRYGVSFADGLGGAVVTERRPSGERRVLLLAGGQPGSAPALIARGEGPLRFLGATDQTAYLYAVDRERILVARRVGGRFRLEEVLDTSPRSASTVHLYGGRLVINGLEDGAPAIFVHDLEGRHLRTLRPPFGLLWTNFPAGRPPIFGDPGSRFAYANSISLDAPGIYEIDLDRLELRPWRLRSGLEAGAVVVDRVQYRSFDAQLIPMALARRADRELDSSAPVLLWVYGAYGFTATPFFNAFFRTFIGAGGVLAMPQVRGGGVHGRSWHRAGSRANKRNTVADTIAAVDWLMKSEYTSAGRVAVLGNSAGSVPAAAAAFERAEAVGALIVEIPLVDLVRHSLWSEGWSTEFGDPANPKELEVLFEVSPYESLKEERRLPPTLILAGENDAVAPPHHAYKLAAAMQNAQSSVGPILLHVVPGAGHQIGVDAAQRLESRAYELAFLHLTLTLTLGHYPGAEPSSDRRRQAAPAEG